MAPLPLPCSGNVGPVERPARALRLLGLLAIVTITAGCSTLGVKIDGRTERTQARETQAVLATAPAASPAAVALKTAQHCPPSEALAQLVEAARLALKSNQVTIYNAAVSQIVTIVANQKFANLPANLSIVRSGPAVLDPALARKITLASSVRIKGLKTPRSVQSGLGVPYVAWFPPKSPFLVGQPGIPPLAGMSIPVTALVTFDGARAQLVFQQTLKSDHGTIEGRRTRLAADFSAPIAVLLSHGKNRSIDLHALFFSQSLDTARLYQFQPYDPKKIPVVFVHGLLSRPEAWTQAMNGLLADPKVRDRYQFWFFLYPTGLPVWRSAAVLRSELDRYHRELDPHDRNPNLDRMVLIGHSMGGLISSLMIREGGDRLWRQFSDVPASSVKLSPQVKKQVLDMIYFAPRKDVARVIFVSTPHQGSYLAVNPIAGFFSSLIRLPINLVTQDRSAILSAIRDDAKSLFIAPANSIVFLRAKSPLLLAILKLPMSKSIPYHSIIGDRGKGDTPNSSDGVVPYWSSHLDGAVSEKIVPSGHGANENPQGIEEIRRILVLNAR
ncbi:MAG TPA: hypothetical protein VNB29_06975 [Chthoniobacterales bacterium]|nr:hypothetical protein [Chthoniobacterales bacterium]